MSEVENQEVEVSAVENLINQITDGDLNNAEGSFQSLIQDKMADALEAQRIATAQAIFNDQDDDVEDIEDEEVELDDDETDIETEEEVEEISEEEPEETEE
jgi:phosphopantothenoylcysteine synthetase/decarboxylase